jgi:phosphomannomutase
MGTIFSTYDIRGRVGQTLTVEYAWTVGKAFAEWLVDEGDIVVAKGTDADEPIVHALIEGLLLQGRNVVDAGEGEQDKVVNAILDNRAVGGLFITHDTLQDIGIITLFDTQGMAVTAERGLETIEEMIDAGNFLPAAEKGEVKTV